MLLSLLATTAMYRFHAGTSLEYNMNTVFDGFIPILGGQEGKAEVKLGVSVDCNGDGKTAAFKVTSELTSAKLLFNDAELPLGLENIQEYFPKTTIQCTPWGKTISTDAPDKTLPVKLPGLDIKRFPDITYMPLEFPKDGVEVDKSWSFVKPFAGSDVTYTCKPIKIDEAGITIKISLEQKYTVLEDASLAIVTNKEDAEQEVETTLSGSGEALFDRKLGVFRTFALKATANSIVTPLHEGEKSTRKLNTSLNVTLVKPKLPEGTPPGSLF